MRRGHSSRADAILNSPIVRSFLRPVTTLIAPIPDLPPTALELISTQPPPTFPAYAPVTSSSYLVPTAAPPGALIQSHKRQRDEEEGGKELEGNESPVVVNYTEDNLPPELTKCTSSLVLQPTA